MTDEIRKNLICISQSGNDLALRSFSFLLMIMKAIVDDYYLCLESLGIICICDLIVIFIVICPRDMIFVNIGLD